MGIMTTLARRNSSIHKVREYSLPKINLEEDYDVLHIIQEGLTGQLLLVENQKTRHEVVLKTFHKTSTSKLEFFREFHYNYYLSPHTNILNAYDVAFETNDYYVFAQEYAPFGDLTLNLLESGIGEFNAKKIIPQVVSALDFMHSKNLVHRNINMDNILVFNIDFSEVKVCDFGSIRKNGSLMKRKTISVPYAAPEVVETVQNEGYYVDTSQDVWQLGILIYILLTGALPWQKADISDPLYNEWVSWKKRKTMKTPKRFSNFTGRCLRMFKRLLEPKPEKRNTVKEVTKYMEDKWLIRPMKNLGFDKDRQSVCYSSFSIHSSKMEKDHILRVLKEHGIETTVDRNAKRKRIHEWIEKSLTNNKLFSGNEEISIKNYNEDDQKILSRIIYIKTNVTDNCNTFIEKKSSSSYTDSQNDNYKHSDTTDNSNYKINSYEYQQKQSPKHNNNHSVWKWDNISHNKAKMSGHVWKSPNIVKRATSFQEQSKPKLTESPCVNYLKIHSQILDSSKPENPKSPEKSSTVDISSQEPPRQGRKKSINSKRFVYRRSKSEARNPTYEFSPLGAIKFTKNYQVEGNDIKRINSNHSSTNSDESLTSVSPAVY